MLVLPHVETTVMATDLAGLKIIRDAGCLECFTTWREAKVKGEVAASAAILQASRITDTHFSTRAGSSCNCCFSSRLGRLQHG